MTEKNNYFRRKNDIVVIKKLKKAFILELSDEDACYFADIKPHELKHYEKKNPKFKIEKQRLREANKRTPQCITNVKDALANNKTVTGHYYENRRYDITALSEAVVSLLGNIKLAKTPEEEIEAQDAVRMLEKEIRQALNLNNKSLLINSICNEQFKAFALELTNQFEEEFNVTTASGKCLTQLAATSFIRYLQSSYDYQSHSEDGESYRFNQSTRNGYLISLSKETNNAFRQFIASITALKNLNAQPISLNILTQNLNVGQNQQFNQSHEINKSQ